MHSCSIIVSEPTKALAYSMVLHILCGDSELAHKTIAIAISSRIASHFAADVQCQIAEVRSDMLGMSYIVATCSRCDRSLRTNYSTMDINNWSL